MKINWPLFSSDITAALTMLAAIPYDKDTLDLVNHIVPASYVPWVIKLGIAATLILRVTGRYVTHSQQQPTKP